MAHHRRLRRNAPPSLGTAAISRRSRADTLDELDDALAELEPVRGAAELRRLAEVANELDAFLEQASEAAWALDDLPDLVDCLYDLGHHRDTIVDLAGLEQLADELDDLAKAVSVLRRHRDDLADAARDARLDGDEE